MNQPHLYYFQPEEFREWYEKMDHRLMVLLDVFRHQWKDPVIISSAPGALGRTMGAGSHSQHNVDKWGEVRAVDIFPRGLATKYDAERAFNIARNIGVTGIGIYPDWQPSVGMHLDVRRDKRPGNPATWGAVGHPQKYVSWAQAVEKLP